MVKKTIDYSHLDTKVFNKVIEITKLLVSSFDIDFILESLKDYTTELIECEKVIIWLIDETTKELYPFKYWGYKPSETVGFRFKSGEGTIGWVYRYKKPVIESDIRDNKNFIRKGVVSDKIHSVLQIPLIFENQVIGVFDAANKKPGNSFSEEDLDVLNILGSFVAIAIHNATLFKRASTRIELLKTINEISDIMINLSDFKEILQIISEKIAEIMEVDLCGIFLLEGKELVLHAVVGLPKKLIGHIRNPFDRGLIGWSAQNKTLVISEDAQNDPRFRKYLTKNIKDHHKSEMCNPILYEDKLLGVISVETKKFKKFQEDEVQMFQILSNEIAVGIHRVQLQSEMKDIYNNVIRIFARITEVKEPETSGHCYRVSRMSEVIARELSFSEKEIEELIIASYLHDIGKLGIPEVILHKNGKLSGSEYKVMRTHPEIGANFLEPFNIPIEIKKTILYHHERYDGKGYPECLKGEEIPLMSRVLTLVDSFDAMVISRSYSTGKSVKLAVEEIKNNSGKQFDPYLVKVFLKKLPVIKEILQQNPVPYSGGY
ncbi:GAF domain-containing protein [Candidatus Dependentiae bacterium]|nr:GAF domain-containing protein [Candidatus Dependentiae bacterium]